MFEGFILGAVQGITEWLPVSSEGALVLAQQALGGNGLADMISVALFLHLGTFFAALIYFWHDVVLLVKTVFSFRAAEEHTRQLLLFLITATVISGAIGTFFLIGISREFETLAQTSGTVITLAVGALLLITAFFQLRAKESGEKDATVLKRGDSIALGIAQGFAVFPGISRSGITVAMLLLRGFKKQSALKLSFLMSLPIVLGGNIALGFSDMAISNEALWGLLFSFVFGLATIKALFAIAEKINFGWFVFVFGMLTIVAAFL